jgi:transaldolase
MKEAAVFTKIAKNIAVKVPLTWDGLKACKALSDAGTMVNVTLCFSPVQAMMAAKAGASFISPFIGRVDDIGEDGMGLIRDIRTIYDNYNYKTEILAASVRHVFHVRDAALSGADVSTIPASVFKALLSHPLTDKGLAAFTADAKKAGVVIKG